MAGKRKRKQRLDIVYPHCAGIDVGSEEHWVAVRPDAAEESVRRFGGFSDELRGLAALGQALAQFDFLGAQIKECDAAIAESLERLPAVGTGDVEMSKVMKSPHRSAQQQTALHRALYSMLALI